MKPLMPPGARLFGRHPDLLHLLNRVTGSGLTVVSGRPRIGKTWLIRTLCDNLASTKNCLIGYCATTSESDVMGQSLSNLYFRWLEDATYREQARSLYERHKGKLTEKVGTFIGGLFSKAVPIVGDAVEKGMLALKSLSEDMRIGGMQFATVPYETVHDLVTSLSTIMEGRPILLVLDAWEQGQNPKSDFGTLRKFLSNLWDWPDNFHVIVIIRDEPKYTPYRELAGELCMSPAAELFDLTPMHLDNDPEEADRVVRYIRELAPGAQNIDARGLLEMVNENPAVLENWVNAAPQTEAALRNTAANAHSNSYPELEAILFGLFKENKDYFTVAVRLAVLYEFTAESGWEPLAPIVLSNAPQYGLTDWRARAC